MPRHNTIKATYPTAHGFKAVLDALLNTKMVLGGIEQLLKINDNKALINTLKIYRQIYRQDLLLAAKPIKSLDQ